MQLRKLLRTAAGLTVYQIVIYFLVSGGKIHQMVHWDAEWYRDIAANGYSVSTPLKHEYYGGDNIAFFPAFPLWMRVFIRGLGMHPDAAGFVAAQTACFGVWAYFLALLDQFRVRAALVLLACLLLMIQPGSFYHVVGYSESLFSASMLGFVFWTNRAFAPGNAARFRDALLAVLHGAILSGTRYVGVPLCGYPLLLAASMMLRDGRWEPRLALRAAATSLSALSGFFAFLAYCQLRWGRWDLYWEANRVGWHVYFNIDWMLHWSYYRDIFFFGNLSEVLGRLITLATLAAAIGLTRWAWKSLRESPFPLALALLNLGFMIETIVGSHGMHSMIRYLVPINCLVLPLGAAYLEKHVKERPSLSQWATLAGVSLFFFALQILFATRYSRGDWVS
jgi:hypothetical protein